MRQDYAPFLAKKTQTTKLSRAEQAARISRFHGLDKPARKTDPLEKRLNPEALEIQTIRTKLGMTQTDFAIALGCSRDVVVNIENGRVKNISRALLEEARRQLVEGGATRAGPIATLEALPVADLLARWQKLVQVDNDSDLADVLGINPYTVERWRMNNRAPRSSSLLRYEKMVQREAKRLEALTGADSA